MVSVGPQTNTIQKGMGSKMKCTDRKHEGRGKIHYFLKGSKVCQCKKINLEKRK